MSTRWSFGVVFSVSAGLLAAVLTGCSSNTSSVAPVAETATADATPADTTITIAPTTRPKTTPAASAPKSAAQKSIVWEPTYKQAWSRAYTAKKPLMIDFYADWCPPCKMMDSETFPDASVVQTATSFISVKVDTDKELELAQKYKVTGLPTTMWLNNKGEIIHKIEGFYPPSEFVKEMKIAQSNFQPLS